MISSFNRGGEIESPYFLATTWAPTRAHTLFGKPRLRRYVSPIAS
jgi:hypothetical protein